MKKISNKTLLVIFLILAVLAVIMYFYDRNKGDRTFKTDLIAVDSSRVTAIMIYPKSAPGKPFSLAKTGSAWEVRSGTRSFPADSSVIANLLHTLKEIKAERVVATGREGWKAFDITNSSCTQVVVKEGEKEVADFRVGKISFSQRKDPYGYGRGQTMDVKSHLRMAGDDRVYRVDGFLSMLFSDQVSTYRVRKVLKLDRSRLTRLSFIYPGDSSFLLEKSGNGWMVNGQPADSAKTASWFGSVSFLTNGEFADEGTIPFAFPWTLKIEGSNMPVTEVRGAFDPATGKYYIKSSENPTAVFGSASPGLFNQLFTAKRRFLK